MTLQTMQTEKNESKTHKNACMYFQAYTLSFTVKPMGPFLGIHASWNFCKMIKPRVS